MKYLIPNLTPNLTPLACMLALAACTAPEIADWPPRAPAVSEATIQRYVDVYGGEPDMPMYGPEDIDALILLSRERFRTRQPDEDIERLQGELEDIQERINVREEPEPQARSRTEINAIKKRVAKRYDSPHRQRMILKSRYGITE